MTKLYVVSDVHSYFNVMVNELHAKGFDENNPEHWFVSCGDLFDRGEESADLLHYVMSLDRKILIRGNHDDLLEQCCARKYAESHDYHNGTIRTIIDLNDAYFDSTGANDMYENVLQLLKPYHDCLLNYFETKKYVFVHGWIPVKREITSKLDDIWSSHYEYSYKRNWRKGTDEEWCRARWSNGIDFANKGLIAPNKTIVCGHWHCSYGHHLDNPDILEFEEDAIWDPWYHKGCIAIDRCTAYTNQCNVLVIEDDFMK